MTKFTEKLLDSTAWSNCHSSDAWHYSSWFQKTEEREREKRIVFGSYPPSFDDSRDALVVLRIFAPTPVKHVLKTSWLSRACLLTELARSSRDWVSLSNGKPRTDVKDAINNCASRKCASTFGESMANDEICVQRLWRQCWEDRQQWLTARSS